MAINFQPFNQNTECVQTVGNVNLLFHLEAVQK